jgi:hypothetical protein
MPRNVSPPEEPIPIRLFDRVRAAGPAIPDVPVIVASAIAEQIDAVPAPEGHSFAADSYGVVAPPFQAFFVEARTTITWAGRQMVVDRGMLVTDLSQLVRDQGPVRGQRPPPGTAFHLANTGYLYSAETGFQPYTGTTVYVHLDAEGRILDDMRRLQVLSEPASGSMAAVTEQAQAVCALVPFVYKAISALHQRCAVEEVTPPAPRPPRRPGRARERELTRHTYYVLQVKPLAPETAEDFRRIGTPERAGSREHRVRGHFKIYTEAKPLFGKYVRTIWVPEHVRGDDSYGEIRKDYEV